MGANRLAATVASILAASLLAACSSSNATGADPAATTAQEPPAGTTESTAAGTIEIAHAFGTTVIEGTPQRVATVQWANHEVPLSLGVVPVGMAEANFGGAPVLPWVEESLTDLGAEQPVLFDETDGIDFEAVANTNPDVILAAYSGLTQEDYDTLTQIAPTVAYPTQAWATQWRDMVTFNAQGMGMPDDGEALIADLEGQIDDAVAGYPELEGTTAMFVTHVDTTDLSTVNFYTTNDPRVAFFNDLGLATPAAVEEASASGEFSGSISAEQVDMFDDVDLIVTYGDQELVDILKADPLLSQMPAVHNNAVVFLDGSTALATAANPTPLAIPWVIDDYVALLAGAIAQ